jgi:hypothetical protein
VGSTSVSKYIQQRTWRRNMQTSPHVRYNTIQKRAFVLNSGINYLNYPKVCTYDREVRNNSVVRRLYMLIVNLKNTFNKQISTGLTKGGRDFCPHDHNQTTTFILRCDACGAMSLAAGDWLPLLRCEACGVMSLAAGDWLPPSSRLRTHGF